MLKTVIPILSVICLIPYCGVNTEAAEIKHELADCNEYTRSVGLISSYSLSISVNGKNILMSGRTQCNDIMDDIGFTNLVIEKSTDNTNWSYCSSVNDILKDDSARNRVSNKQITTVSGGYYYRLTCNHYAKEYGSSGLIESIFVCSNSVYIP